MANTPTKLDIDAVKKAMANTPGLNYVDAARQVRGVQNAPAPVTPAPVTPAPTPQPVMQQMSGMNVAERQAVRNAQPTPTPVTPAPVVQPEQPTPVQKVDPTPGITPETFNQAKVESEKIKAQNEAAMALNKQQSELRQTETAKANEIKTAEAKQVQDQANAALANDENAILTTLKTGGMIPESVKSSPFYKSAQDTFNKVRAFSTYSVNNLVGALNNGSILPGTKLYNELLSDPAMKEKLTKAQTFTATQPVDITKVTQNVSDTILSSNPTLATALADGVITMDEYNQATNNPEVVAKAKDVETKTNKYNELKAEYDDIENKVKADFPGSPFADAIIADRQKAKYKNLVLAKGEVDSAIGTLTELKTQSSSLFDKNLELYKQRQAESQQIASEQRQVQAQKDLMEYKSDFEKQQQQEALNDPYQAIPAMIEEYKKLGVPFTRSTQQVISDFQSSGQDLPTYLSGLQKLIQSKPEYQKIQSLQQGQMSDSQKLAASQNFEIKKMGMEQDFQMKISQAKNLTSNKWTKLDDGLYQDESGNIMTADEMKAAKLMGNSNITKQVGEEGGECGVYATRSVGMSSTPGGNSKDARKQAFADTTPQVGGLAFFGGAGYDPTYGHISIVTGYNPENGTITVKESNYNNDKKVTERTVPANSATGYYNNTPLAKGVSGETTTQPTSSEANSWVNAWNNGTMDIETILTKIGNTKEALPLKNEVIKAIDAQGGVAWRKENDPMVTKVDDLINKLDTASKSSYINTIAGNVQTSLTNFLTGGKNDLLADLKSVIEGGTLQALIDAKAQGATFGALSNEELKMLQATSSALAGNAIRDPDTKEIVGFKMSETKLKSEIEKMKNMLIEKKNRMTGAGIKNTTEQSNTAPAYIPQEVDNILLEWNNRK